MKSMNPLIGKRSRTVALGASVLLLATVFGSGCNNAGEGALTGAGLGALAGMGIGAMSGNMGEGAAIGAIVGGVGGAIIGDQNERNDRRSNNDW